MYKCIVCVKKCTYICYIIYLYLSFETPQSCNRSWTMFQNRPLALQAIYPQKTMPIKTQLQLPHNINHLIFSSGKSCHFEAQQPHQSPPGEHQPPISLVPQQPSTPMPHVRRPRRYCVLPGRRDARSRLWSCSAHLQQEWPLVQKDCGSW